ncbi:DUF6913 domain-containing protein [Xanthomarina sp. F2636L]|uniref:DUF6913 domain-containing protein n=1 Tax=Xanthomarina sp. F2636L TaxID=2996018 RepID=UPI00225DDBF8|nr:hypothetical protein [Xanthomarina sp. F2636L]MCX7552195.1 hypothetical protein [Xanthomarina sp. F2636L]
MILKGLKEKSIKKNLNTILANRETHFNTNKIESIGIVLNADETTDFESIKTIAQSLNLRPNKLKIIAFTESKKEVTYSWNDCFNPKDFTWNGKVNNIELQTFLDTKFDLLISYYSKDVLELKFLTTASKAHFKVSIFQLDKRLNDLIIKTDFKDFEAFKIELNKYLRVLNKLNT